MTSNNNELNDYLEVIQEAELSASNEDANKIHEKSNQVELAKLEENYRDAIKEIENLKDQLLRNLAETDNFRKRTAKQIEDSGKFAVANFAKDLTEVLENLYLASANIPKDKIIEDNLLLSIFKGVEITQKNLLNIFEKYGINRLNPSIGDIFDHNVHEAVSQIENNDAAPNSIISVMRAGYVLNDRLLKPAMVIVAKSKQN